MEMNTRLQVEHPVTEAITGVDLVEWQLRVAAGEPLPVAQPDLRIDGHAIEARIYAEDVVAGFLPATGRLSHLVFPPDARADSGVRAGDLISPHYDPMIAKLIVHGQTRALALSRLRAALAVTEIAGTVTNHAFLRKLAENEGFAAGDVDTGLIARDLAALTAGEAPAPGVVALAALTALGLPAAGATGFALWNPLTWSARLDRDREEIAVKVTVERPARFAVEAGGERTVLELRDGAWWVDGGKTGLSSVRHGATITVFAGDAFAFDAPDPLARGQEAGAGADVVLSPMPGRVTAVDVAAGQAVGKGQRLAVLEAMKMEHALTAARDGVVAEVLVAAGAQVEAGAPLVRLEADDG
jgi:3-methylcrotonyl-CoA carboxylase alpha subunit